MPRNDPTGSSRQSKRVWSVLLSLLAPFTAEAEVDYLRNIKPVLKERCYACHGALKQKAGLRVDTAQRIHAGARGDAVVAPGAPDQSELLARLTSEDDGERMPPEGEPLKPSQLEAIREWIAKGAPIPKDERGEDDPRDHWAFQTIEKPAVPESDFNNPIDAFLDVKRQELGLKTQPEAERSILIRRAYLDLIGLPPTGEQLETDSSFEAIIDDLLASPHHGERWGRHWMDVWRYSDWYGLGAQLRYSQKHLWRWRDWIIESLNEDKGYDRMIQEMLAGDELDPGNPDVVRGTGYLARNYYLFNRTTWLDSTIEHTGKAFLGLTLNCAKCHDHKYDPIEMVDYYRFRALFEPHQVRLDPVPGETDFEKDGLPRVFDNHPDAKTRLHVRGDPKNPDDSIEITPGVPAIFADFAPEIEPVKLPVSEWAPALRGSYQKTWIEWLETNTDAATAKLSAARKKLEAVLEGETKQEKPEPEKPAPDAAPAFSMTEDFDGPNPEVWELIGEGWEFRDGALHQTVASREAHRARLRQALPENFELTCRYTHTGGSTYKSVTFRFDFSEDGGFANYVYTSAHEAGPKLQVAYTRDGKSVYPPEGRAGKPIKVGEPYELKFAVRDQLVNVWLNGQFAVAYRFPDRRPKGSLALSGFDATVAFDSLSIRSLPDDRELTEAKAGAAPSKLETSEGARAAVKLAEAELKSAERSLVSMKAALVADRAKFLGEGDEETLAAEAARREAESTIANAEYWILQHRNNEKELKKAKESLAKGKEQLAAAEKGEGTYTSIRGAKKALESPAHKEADYPATYPKVSTGRRLALAKWITSKRNPLTARVAVNHVWMRHFGEPLVESVFDFGRQAKEPEQAALLDFLAAEFMDSGWSFKHLHRLMATSQAYRMSSTNAGADSATMAADGANRFYWRMNPRRMESQIVRDSLLQLAGALDPALGGPSIDPNSGSTRRSVYFKHSRDQQDKFLTMFDDADLLQCYRRSESVVPQQALALSNSQLAFQSAAKIAQRLFEVHPSADRDSFIDTAFSVLLCRQADDSERQACRDYWDELAELLERQKVAEPDSRIRARLVHALLNHNDFVTVR